MSHWAELSHDIQPWGSGLGLLYLATVVAVILRVELLRARGLIPAGVGSAFDKKYGPDPRADTWTRIRSQGGMMGRIAWVVGFILGPQHRKIGDPLTSALIYVARALLAALLLLLALETMAF